MKVPPRPLPRLLRSLLASLVALPLLVATASTTPASASVTDGRHRPGWPQTVPGAKFHFASPALGDVNGDGANDVVIGGQNGWVYAFNGSGGALPGWPQPAVVFGGATAVDASAAIGDVDGDGRNEVVVGAGSLDQRNQNGGVIVFEGSGARRCAVRTGDKFNQWTGGGPDGFSDGVFNAPAIGDVDGDGVNDIVFGAWDHRIYLATGTCGVRATFDNTDTVWSSPALRDIDGDRQQDIFIGGDATACVCGLPHAGGYMRSLRFDGVALVERWRRQPAESLQNTPSIGDINGDGRLEVVIGSGNSYKNADSRKVWAFHADDGSDVPGWPATMNGSVFLSSPALGDVSGDGRTDVVIGSLAGDVAAFGGNGGLLWRQSPGRGDEVVSSPVIGDVNGDGRSEVIVGTGGQFNVLRGSDGATLNTFSGGRAHKGAAAIGQIGSGWGVVATGFDPADGNRGWVEVFDTPTPASAPAWGQFRKNARRLGTDSTDAPPLRCDPGFGYWLTASDGGVFAFGAPFHGSTGNIALNQPIVGMTAKPDQSGYWFVARDGGIFSFGGSAFHGSTGGIPLNRPIVGMATTPDGGGYWLVASDGGIFSFGNASFFGSTGDSPLNRPIVGMSAMPDGKGYWLVASDGGIFAFGSAKFRGSTGAIRLNSPIVAMAATPGGVGYWLVAADGGVFAFDAPYLGSTGAVRLNQPIVGVQRTRTGNGYSFVARDGGMFAFGDAQFCGSMGGRRLNQSIVAMAS